MQTRRKVMSGILSLVLILGAFIGLSRVNVSALGSKDMVEVKGKKIWEDNQDREGLRPQKVTVHLLANGKIVDSDVISAKDNWEYEFKADIYDEFGHLIHYTLEEEKIPNYTSHVIEPIVTVEKDVDVELGDKYSRNNNKDAISYRDDLGVDDIENAVVVVKLTDERENKGSNLFVWSLRELSVEEQNKLKDSVYLYPELKQNDLTFYFHHGLATFDVLNKEGQEITFDEDAISFSHKDIWSLIVPGTYDMKTIAVASDSFITNQLLKPVSLSLEATKCYVDQKLHNIILKGGEFEFVLSDETNSYFATNDKEGKILFKDLIFTHVGDYEYTLSEVKGTDKNISYDEHIYKVIIHVEDTGELKASIIDKEDEYIFKNIYKGINLTPIDPSTPSQPIEDETLGDKENPVNTSDYSSIALFTTLSLITVVGITIFRKKGTK